MTLNRNCRAGAGVRCMLAALPAIVLLLAACDSGDAVTAAPPKRVRTLVVADGAPAETTQYTAEIRSRFETDLSFQVSGKLLERPVDVGATVSRGDVLATVDDTDQRLGVDAARSAVAAARAELERAQSEEARYRDLLERGLATRAAHVSQQTAVKTSQSRLEQAVADLRLSEQRLSYTVLRADHDGVVTEVHAEAGAVVAPGEPVLSIARPSDLEAVFDVPDGRIDDIRDSASLEVTEVANPERRVAAIVREISPSADPLTRTYQVRAAIAEAPAHWRLGMSVTAVLPRGSAAASLSLPASALFQADGAPAVWVVGDTGVLELRPVTVERYETAYVLVSAGLAAGDRVVTAGVHRLAAGETVRLAEGVSP